MRKKVYENVCVVRRPSMRARTDNSKFANVLNDVKLAVLAGAHTPTYINRASTNVSVNRFSDGWWVVVGSGEYSRPCLQSRCGPRKRWQRSVTVRKSRLDYCGIENRSWVGSQLNSPKLFCHLCPSWIHFSGTYSQTHQRLIFQVNTSCTLFFACEKWNVGAHNISHKRSLLNAKA